MAHHIEEKIRTNISARKVWEVLADFGNVDKWHFSVKKSPMMDGKPFGLGAKRTCRFYNGTSVVEEIIEYREGNNFVVEITEFSMPLKSIIAGTKVEAIDGNSCDITIDMDFVVKGGPLGWVMGIVIVKPTMKRLTKKLLTGLAYHAATKKIVGDKLPSQQELSSVFSR
jgi:hypothetical protein